MEENRTNELIEIQKLLKKQMKRLDEAVAGEVKIETARSGALSQNAGAYIKAVNTSIKVKEMVKNNPQAEDTILSQLGVLNNE
jgi:hypothetical protein